MAQAAAEKAVFKNDSLIFTAEQPQIDGWYLVKLIPGHIYGNKKYDVDYSRKCSPSDGCGRELAYYYHHNVSGYLPIETYPDMCLDIDESTILEHEQYKEGLQAEMDQASAEAMTRWEQTEQAKAEAAARAQLAALDNLMKKAVVDECHKFIEGLATPAFNLPENTSDHCDLVSRFKSALDCYENGGQVR